MKAEVLIFIKWFTHIDLYKKKPVRTEDDIHQ